MKVSIFIKILLVTALLNGCSTSKNQTKSRGKIEGHYEVVKQEHSQTNNNATITGVVYDKKTGNPLGFALVQIKDINKGVVADTLGKFSFDVQSGIYQIEVSMVGNTALLTEPTKFEANTKTEIIFYLGTTWIY